jgi:hypothetical protein
MKKYVISYGTKGYYENLDILEKSAISVGMADKFVKYTYDNLKDSAFYIDNKSIMSRPLTGEVWKDKARSAHYWIYKPYIILETMKQCEGGDIILYIDGGMRIINNLLPLFEITKSNKDKCMIFSASKTREPLHYHSVYTKRDCFILMGLDSPRYWNSRCVNSAISTWMKTPENIAFLEEWIYYNIDPRIVTEDDNVCGQSNLPDFKYHLFDQSVLSLLCAKYGREIYREPSQYSIDEKNDFINSPYNQLVIQHHVHLFT